MNRGAATTTGDAAGGWLTTIVPWMDTGAGAGCSQLLVTNTWNTFGWVISNFEGTMDASVHPGGGVSFTVQELGPTMNSSWVPR